MPYLTGVGVPAGAPVTPALDSSPRRPASRKSTAASWSRPVAQLSAWRIGRARCGAARRAHRRSRAAVRRAEPGGGLDPFVRLDLRLSAGSSPGSAATASSPGLAGRLVDASPAPAVAAGRQPRRPARRAVRSRPAGRAPAVLAAVAERRGEDAAQAMSRRLGALTRRMFGARRTGGGAEPAQEIGLTAFADHRSPGRGAPETRPAWRSVPVDRHPDQPRRRRRRRRPAGSAPTAARTRPTTSSAVCSPARSARPAC